MLSRIAEELKLRYSPIAVVFTDDKPEGALQFKEDARGCVVALFTAAAKGRTVVVDRKTVGCFGAITGLGFGCAYDKVPGGIDYFLSTGRGPGYPEGEAYKKTPELAAETVAHFPTTDIPYEFVVFKPLDEVDADVETPVLVSFWVNPDQLSALVMFANYARPGNENVIVPMAAACSTVCLIPYHESQQQTPRAVIGLTDVTARPFIDPDILAFTVPYRMYAELEADVPGSFLEKQSWKKVRERIV